MYDFSFMFIPTFLLNFQKFNKNEINNVKNNIKLDLFPDNKNFDFVKIYNNLDKPETIQLIHKDFNNKQGIYGIKCNVTEEIYIGSAEN